MARRARELQRAVCYHLMNRGVNGANVFVDDQDRERFTSEVREYAEACAAQVYHW